jgi:hypothetical protein
MNRHIALLIGYLALAACTSGAVIAFSTVVTAVQTTCGILLDLGQESTINQVIKANPTLTSVSQIATFLCGIANTLPAAQAKALGVAAKVTIPVTLPDGSTVYITGVKQ